MPCIQRDYKYMCVVDLSAHTGAEEILSKIATRNLVILQRCIKF
jgi:hypothetical protein